MKKILLGSSALTFASAAATGANAAEWDLDWGGFFEAGVAYSSFDVEDGVDGDFNGFDVVQDSEIIFTPSITLDNGLKFGVDIQLEGNTSGDTIDESFIFIKGSFGQILIGSENSAGYKMSYGAPDSTWIGVNSGSTSQFMPWATGFRTIRETSFLEVDGNNDAQRLTYFTPRFSGFQLGASYARDANQGGGQADLDTELGNIFDVGANYVNTLGGVDVALAGRYGTADAAAGDDPTVYAIGLNLGFAGFTVGGSYAGQDGGQAVNEGNFWDVGASYTTGPWAASLTYSQSDGDDGTENMRIIGGASYKLGPGVKAGAYAGYAENDRGLNPGEGFYVGTGVKLNF